MQQDTVGFFAGQATNTMGINGNILGPTLIMDADSVVNISVTNNIGDTTTMHWHGLHVAPENDGGPHSMILPGNTWNPSFTIMDKAATYWYHPHMHGKTNPQVTMGLAGMLIVKDAEEAALALPRTYGVDDFPLILQSKAFDANNQIMVNSHEDSTFMINGTIDPYLDAPAQVVRFRLLNASSSRTLYMGLDNGMSFDQIASDGGLLSAPASLTRLRLAPGERAEILVDLTGMMSQTVNLVNYCQELPLGLYGAQYPAVNQSTTLPNYANNPLNLVNYTMLQINVVAQTGSPILTVPATLANVTPILEATSMNTRTITFGTAFPGPLFLQMPFLMNGVYFDMMVINEYVPLNNIEVWELTNNTQTHHPWHIHDVQFYILDIDGNPPPPNEAGRKDVVLVPPFTTVRFITEFLDFENDTIPYMYHCHMLRHDDMGMMAQFIVSSTIGVPETPVPNKDLSFYPNPSSNVFYLDYDLSEGEVLDIKLFDLNGRLVMHKPNWKADQLDMSLMPRGTYLYQVEGQETHTGKLTLN